MKMLQNSGRLVFCYILRHTHPEMCLFSHITCLLLSAKTCLAKVALKGIKCYSWMFWIILEENRKTAVMEITSSVLNNAFWAASSSHRERDSKHATKAHFLAQMWRLLLEKRSLVSLEFKAAVLKCSLSPASCDKSRLLRQNSADRVGM